MHDELIFENRESGQRQSEIIREYCSGVEERIDDASSREDAERIVNETCTLLEQTCESEVLRAFLRSLMETRIKQRWQMQT